MYSKVINFPVALWKDEQPITRKTLQMIARQLLKPGRVFDEGELIINILVNGLLLRSDKQSIIKASELMLRHWGCID